MVLQPETLHVPWEKCAGLFYFWLWWGVWGLQDPPRALLTCEAATGRDTGPKWCDTSTSTLRCLSRSDGTWLYM